MANIVKKQILHFGYAQCNWDFWERITNSAICDIIESMVERKAEITKVLAPPGTYSSLEHVHNQHEGEIHPSLGKIVRLKFGKWQAGIRKEEVCPEGGTCIDLVVKTNLGRWGNLVLTLVHQIHVSQGDDQGDNVLRRNSYIQEESRFVKLYGFGARVTSRPVPQPKVQQILQNVGLK